jgi:hypothetical protein
MTHSSQIISPYVKDLQVENIFGAVNDHLYDLETQLVSGYTKPQYPTIFICGPPRSGTTLLMQLVIACFKVGYVNNLMARFWKVPYIGAVLAHELRRRQSPRSPEFVSELGTTYGYEGPHEFGFFWQKWFPYNETHQTSEEDLQKQDTNRLLQELAAMESIFDAPLAFKNGIVLSLNIPTLATLFPKAVFLVCQREPVYIAQSILQARIKAHGDKKTWWSVKPQEYTWLKNLPYLEQIAGQVYYTEKRIQESLSNLEAHRFIKLDYREICKNPVQQMERIQTLFEKAGYQLQPTGFRPDTFPNANEQKLPYEEFQRLEGACEQYWKNRKLRNET